MSNEIINQFETLVSSRMQRLYLLEKAQFQFKQYQYDGVQWCVRNELRPNPPGNARGGFIADEMGLGKTIMMIGTMFVNFLPRTLIVVPPVLIQQWFNEIYKASGHKALLYYGDKKKSITLSDINSAPIVLTTYNSLLYEECLLKNVVWNRVIFDEAHHLRNSATRRYRSCKQIKARVRWLVTGTPVQNKKQDFYNLCCASGMKSSFYTDPNNLRTIGRNFVLRRTKGQVGINLPPVNKNNKVVEWKNRNEMLLSEEIHSLLPNQTGVSGAKRRKLAEVFGPKGSLVAILRARQSCVLPNLMRKNIEMFSRMGFLTTEYLEALNYSSKLDAVVDLMLERQKNGKGKIVFCHYQNEIDVIAQRLEEGGMQKVVRYDGRNSGGENLASLAEPADALVIQIQTGCEGLNLQHNFSEIYFVSPHWNPCVEDQSIARCHRIGQLNPVDVFKFEMRGFAKDQDAEFDSITLEKYVNRVQEIKRDISRQILDESKDVQ
jgi:SNF2 family DNA or RNA helicase